MCARFRSVSDPTGILSPYTRLLRFNWPFNPNVAPTDAAPIIRSGKDGPAGELACFGLVHSWAKDRKKAAQFINARSETIREKPAFAKAYGARRCIIPAAGFYEWKTIDGKKQPYQFYRQDGRLLNLAGIWEYAEIDGEKLFSFAIVTTEPNAFVAEYHDRMPIAVNDDRVEAWLDPANDVLADPAMGLPLDAYAVRPMNPAMNSPRLKDAAAMEP